MSSQELEKVMREARTLFKVLSEYVQRKLGSDLDKARIRFKYGEVIGEALLLGDKVFVINDISAKDKELSCAEMKQDGSFGTMQKSKFEDLEKHLSQTQIPATVFIKEKSLASLRKLFGGDIEVLLHNL
jgi:hypothetical protein